MPLEPYDFVSPVWREGIFNNKVVFCTGGAGSICSAQVRALVYLGANAAIIGRNVEKTERMAQDIATARKGAKVIGIGAVDVRKPELLQAAADRTVKELGSIDFVIAGAAGNFLTTIDNLSTNAMKSVIDIDILGSYNTVKATLPYLVESAGKHKTNGKTAPQNGTGGRIIFVSATLHYQGTVLQSHVSVAKAGIDAMSVSVAIEQGPKGVTSNVIAPGPIAGTEGMARLSKKENLAAANKAVPVGRFGYVKEIADATVYLFSDAGNFVNGETVVVDGGAWHTAGFAGGFEYPEFLLSGEQVTGVAGSTKKSKL
ncbi:peroxisomal 2,4-dienoyl-CoA reductase-like protein SPS19 [Dothidotthia symphoricarpi CBS 119687]|uniref:2,4-dienoyl-CoA reductase [(3E)-enoyl-CoA-producing] n=1 Tax=Dothidotthia symphoricarpi CBS 119687 TaxID=1392245 RepID=A0A6A6A2E1_9PLEO|nr:peroxisomal 2,4-dienoyl-CoA reductase-like protein SPS19 [Dothidotthia symphoricarpi CBS 119687]KAF2126019.1 peroxisomal 2,4-dienoyl-CoA reductase-like protein SPS19 [Dothidotthia symphoricarpi CBS 119687]